MFETGDWAENEQDSSRGALFLLNKMIHQEDKDGYELGTMEMPCKSWLLWQFFCLFLILLLLL